MEQWPPPTTVFRAGAPTLGVPLFEVEPRDPLDGGATHPLDARFARLETRANWLEQHVYALQDRVDVLEGLWVVRAAAWITRVLVWLQTVFRI
jgi:hypothetical protein